MSKRRLIKNRWFVEWQSKPLFPTVIINFPQRAIAIVAPIVGVWMRLPFSLHCGSPPKEIIIYIQAMGNMWNIMSLTAVRVERDNDYVEMMLHNYETTWLYIFSVTAWSAWVYIKRDLDVKNEILCLSLEFLGRHSLFSPALYLKIKHKNCYRYLI